MPRRTVIIAIGFDDAFEVMKILPRQDIADAEAVYVVNELGESTVMKNREDIEVRAIIHRNAYISRVTETGEKR